MQQEQGWKLRGGMTGEEACFGSGERLAWMSGVEADTALCISDGEMLGSSFRKQQLHSHLFL